MGEKEQGAAREAGSGMATGRVFPETNVAQSDAEGGGIAIEEEGVQRTGQPLGSAAYAATGRGAMSGQATGREGGHTVGGDWDGMDIGDPGDETGRAKKPGGKVIVKDLKTHL